MLLHPSSALARRGLHRILAGVLGLPARSTFMVPATLFRRPLVLHLRGSEFATFSETECRLGCERSPDSCSAEPLRVILLGECLGAVAGLVPDTRIAVVPNGIDVTAFDLLPAPARRPKSILFLSSLRRRKGILLFLRAFAEVHRRHPDATATIAGVWHDRGDKAEAEALVQRRAWAR